MKNKKFKCAIKTTLFILLLINTIFGISRNKVGTSASTVHAQTLAQTIITDEPMITILTHGLGGGAKDWSNNMRPDGYDWVVPNPNHFYYDPSSLIVKIQNSLNTDANLYRVHIDSNYVVTCFNNYEYENGFLISSITNFNSHSIFVVDFEQTHDRRLDTLSHQLHLIIDSISLAYFNFASVLPSINLIGHSLGGLLNMVYTIQHPKNVKYLVSLGTPYNGSWYDNFFVESLGINTFNELPGKCITGECGHHFYYCNLDVRKTYWNEMYTNNPHLSFHAISASTHSDFLAHIIEDNQYLETHTNLSNFAIGALRLFYLDNGYITLPGDGCVDTDSQKANGFNGVINFHKEYTPENANCSRRSQNELPLPHNLETYDSDIHDYILQNISFGEPYIIDKITNKIVKYNVTYTGQLTIPHYIDDTFMNKIGFGAFSGKSTITSFEIPSIFSTIHAKAFFNTNGAPIFLKNRTSAPSTFHYYWNYSKNPVYLNNILCSHLNLVYAEITTSKHTKICSVCRTLDNTSYHTYDEDVAWLNYTEHYAACECGQDGTFGHVIDGNNYLLPGRHYQCLVCGGPANLGFVFGAKNNDNITVCTENGSYCLPNGILVLVGDDVEAFQNGTLGFIEDYYRHSKKEFH